MKSCFPFSISLSFLLHLLCVCHPCSVSAAPTYIWHNCSNTTVFAPNSTYQSNLNTLLSNLSSAAAAANKANGFANATAGQNPPDVAYGLFLCRGDIDTSTCSDCVATGKQDILLRCPKQRVSVIWYVECMLQGLKTVVSAVAANADTAVDPKEEYFGHGQSNKLQRPKPKDVLSAPF